MNRTLLSAAAVALGLVVAGAAQAGDKGGSYGGSSHSYSSHGSYSRSFGSHYRSYHNYHKSYGTPFKYGYFYSGRYHYHWSKFYWNTRYGCYFYFCPCNCCYYYWYEPKGCYFPVSYIDYATPTVFPTPPVASATAAAAANATNKSNQIVNVVTAPNGQAGNNGVPPSAIPLPPAPAGANAEAVASPMPGAR